MSVNGCVCGSTNCKKYNICKQAICEEENKWYSSVNWHDYGSVNYTDNRIEEEWYCGEHGNYAMFEPLNEPLIGNKNRVLSYLKGKNMINNKIIWNKIKNGEKITPKDVKRLSGETMESKEAIRRIKDHFNVHDDGRPTHYLDKAVNLAIRALEENEKIKKDLKYYLDTNEENGVVYVPKFVIEKIVYG